MKRPGPHAVTVPSWHQLPSGQGDEHGAASVDWLIQPSAQGGAVHCSGLLLPAGDSGENDGQGRQAALSAAVESGWKVPLGQTAHWNCPV